VESLQNTLDITERCYRQGLIGPVDVRLARANLESAKVQEPAIASALAVSRHSLDVLVGRQPGVSSALPETLPDLPELGSVPVGVPGALLDRRPDVRAAEFALRAANERIGVSVAQLYPNLVLTATYGGVVLDAMRQVEDALISEQLLQRQLEYTQLQLQESKAAEDLSRRRYEQGVEGLLTVLESERYRRVAEEQAAVLQGQIWTNRVNLHLALGGDWAGADAAESQLVKK